MAKAAIAKKALPNCNIVCLTGDELKTNASAYLQVLFDADPKAVGGAMPGDDFYWTAERFLNKPSLRPLCDWYARRLFCLHKMLVSQLLCSLHKFKDNFL